MNRTILTYLFIIILFSGCRIIYPEIKYEPIRFGHLYFPTYDENKYKSSLPDSLKNSYIFHTGPNDSLSNFQNKWYSKHLNSLNEPILYDKTTKNYEIIRLTVLGTWSRPYSYRIENKRDKVKITHNVTNGLGGYQAKRRIRHEVKVVSTDKWNQIINEMTRIDFYNIKTHDPNVILDGEEWILEVLINNKYHFVTRNCPDYNNGKEYAELCKLIKQTFE